VSLRDQSRTESSHTHKRYRCPALYSEYDLYFGIDLAFVITPHGDAVIGTRKDLEDQCTKSREEKNMKIGDMLFPQFMMM